MMTSFRSSRLFLLMLFLPPAMLHSIAQALVSQPGTSASAATNTPTARLSSADVSHYTIGIADVLHVNVWKNPDLSQSVTVGPDGFVSLSLLGDVRVIGLTTTQLATLLTERLANYVLTPQVSVSVVEIRSRQIYVMGQVAKPGSYPMLGQMNVLQMIAQAGGLTTFAHRRGIYVLRSNHGAVQKLAYNYSDVMHGKGDKNFDLQPGDTVVIP